MTGLAAEASAGELSSGQLWAAVPFKGPVGSKRRLAGLLDQAERTDLSLAMLDGVLDALLATPGLTTVLLMLPAGVSPSLRRHDRLVLVTEDAEDCPREGVDSLNLALRQAQAVASAGGADGLLILPSDLPSFGPSDLEALLMMSQRAPVVIAPDRAQNGTNALLLRPPLALNPSFGEASFGRHRQLATMMGLDVALVERPGLALDLDTPADVARLLASGHDSRATRLLRQLGVLRRLERLGLAQAAGSGA